MENIFFLQVDSFQINYCIRMLRNYTCQLYQNRRNENEIQQFISLLLEKNEVVVSFVKRDYKFPHGILVSSYDVSKVLRQTSDDKCFAF